MIYSKVIFDRDAASDQQLDTGDLDCHEIDSVRIEISTHGGEPRPSSLSMFDTVTPDGSLGAESLPVPPSSELLVAEWGPDAAVDRSWDRGYVGGIAGKLPPGIRAILGRRGALTRVRVIGVVNR